MNPIVVVMRSVQLAVVILLMGNLGCTPQSTETRVTVGPQCSIAWDKTNDPKVTGYQLTVTDESKQAKKSVRFIPADTTKVSCKDAGASHEGLWSVTVQSCYDKTTCGSPTEVARMHITAK